MTTNCERCHVELDPKKIIWLELDSTTGLYHDHTNDPVPEDKSQGMFPFGTDCAAATIENGGKLWVSERHPKSYSQKIAQEQDDGYNPL